MPNETEVTQLSAQIGDLVQRVEFISDPAVRANVQALLQSLMDLHCRGFSRITEVLLQEGDVGRRILQNLAADELVGGLLMLYGFHPDAIEMRVEKAVEKIQNCFRTSASGNKVELLGITDGVVHLRFTSSEQGCGASSPDKMIEDFIYSAAPDVSRIEIERLALPRIRNDGLVQLQLSATAIRT